MKGPPPARLPQDGLGELRPNGVLGSSSTTNFVLWSTCCSIAHTSADTRSRLPSLYNSLGLITPPFMEGGGANEARKAAALWMKKASLTLSARIGAWRETCSILPYFDGSHGDRGRWNSPCGHHQRHEQPRRHKRHHGKRPDSR